VESETTNPNKPRWKRILELEAQAREVESARKPASSGKDSKTFGIFVMAAIGLIWMLRSGGDPENAPSVTSNQTSVASRPDQSASFNDEKLSRSQSNSVTDLRQGLVNGKRLEVITVSAMNLFREYERNEVAADLRLQGKIVEIQGTVTGINKDFWDSVYVTLRTPNEFMSADVRPINSDIEKIARLRKGQLVTFRCEKMMRFAGAPSGSKCVLVND